VCWVDCWVKTRAPRMQWLGMNMPQLATHSAADRLAECSGISSDLAACFPPLHHPVTEWVIVGLIYGPWCRSRSLPAVLLQGPCLDSST